jgi:HlyD family secretion protein
MKMKITVGRIVLGLAAVAAIALSGWSLLPRPIPVETAIVTKGTFIATVDEDGKTRIRDRYVVAAPLAGRLTRVRLKAGDSIKSDETVATILPAPAPFLDPRSRQEAQERLGAAEATRERTQAAVQRAQAQSAQAATDLERVRTLVQRGAATTQALEHSELAQRVAERDLRAAEFLDHATEHEVQQAKALLARYDGNPTTPPEQWLVTAPVSGAVLNVKQESETSVQAGAPLIEIGDPHDLEIVVDVLSTDAVEIRPGTEVTIDHWGGPGVLVGRVRRVEPAAFTKISTLGVEEQRVNVVIDIGSARQEWARLGDAYQLDAHIVVFKKDDATILPSGALFRTGNEWSVYVVLDGRAQRRPVDLLRRAGRLATIAAGLEPGDTVIIYPSDRVAPGVAVAPRNKS